MMDLLNLGIPIVSVTLSLMAAVTAFMALNRQSERATMVHGKLSDSEGGPIVEDFKESGAFASGADVNDKDEG